MADILVVDAVDPDVRRVLGAMGDLFGGDLASQRARTLAGRDVHAG